jgi:hypothetical protein
MGGVAVNIRIELTQIVTKRNFVTPNSLLFKPVQLGLQLIDVDIPYITFNQK